MNDKELLLFSSNIRRAKDKRIYKVTNSYGIIDGFKYYKSIRPKNKKYIITDSQYRKITRIVNRLLSELLYKGEDIIFPHRLGGLEVRKFNSYLKFENGKIKSNLPINWHETLKLWHQDSECFKNKTLIRSENKEMYKIKYTRVIANYENKGFYEFKVNRELSIKVKQHIRDNNIEVFSS